jgi:hypothetical protein
MDESRHTPPATMNRIPVEKESAVKTALARWALRALINQQSDKPEPPDESQ